MSAYHEAFIIDAVRTPMGRKGGTLSHLRADQLAAAPLRALVERTGIDPNLIEDVVMGCVTQVGEQGLNIARNAALIAGLPIDVTGVSVNRMCGSSQQALNFAAMGVASGFQDIVIAAGVENMSRIRMGADMFYEGEMVTPSPEMAWRYTIVPQGISAELVAKRYGLDRAALDAYSLQSHQRAAAAQDAGAFDAEICPVTVTTPDGTVTMRRDEGIRRDTTLERLGKLKPAFQDDGVITAGSASQISDGASAVLLASAAAVKQYGLKPRARILSMATAGCDPTIMLTAPVPATQKALARVQMKMRDIDLVEINEAFASVALGCGGELGFDFDKTNVHGGAIALGHPLGASGCRLMTTLLHALERRDQRFGLSTMCIGFGQGIATLIDREIYV
jgi:acetyl-CoA acetyltransferase family protein